MEVNRLLKCFKDYSCDGVAPKKQDVVKIVRYLNKRYYEQILNSYPTSYPPIVIKFLEEIEDYEACQKMVNRIKVHNHISQNYISPQVEDCK